MIWPIVPVLVCPSGIPVESLVVYETGPDPAIESNVQAFLQRHGVRRRVQHFSPCCSSATRQVYDVSSAVPPAARGGGSWENVPPRQEKLFEFVMIG